MNRLQMLAMMLGMDALTSGSKVYVAAEAYVAAVEKRVGIVPDRFRYPCSRAQSLEATLVSRVHRCRNAVHAAAVVARAWAEAQLEYAERYTERCAA